MHGRHSTSRDATRERAGTGGGSAAVRVGAERIEYFEGERSRMPSLV